MYPRIKSGLLSKARVIFALLTALFANPLHANMGEPPSPRHGNITGDSYLNRLTILREDLTINMLDINEGKPVKVRARYIIDCPELLKNIDLVFVANGLTESRYKVELDGKFVNGYLQEYETIPSSWLPPDTIKGGERHIAYFYTHRGLISFRLDSLTTGQHTLTVDYDAEASEWFDENELSVTRTLVYILKPTDKWKGFEKFHLVVFHPEDWEFTSNLKLERSTSTALVGDWPRLPDSFISIAIRKPPGPARIKSILFLTFSWLTFISLALFWMVTVIKWRVRRNRMKILQIISSFLVAVITSVFFFLVYFKNQDLLEVWLDDHLNPLHTYGTGYYVLTFPFVLVVACVIVFWIDFLLTRRIKSQRKRTAQEELSTTH